MAHRYQADALRGHHSYDRGLRLYPRGCIGPSPCAGCSRKPMLLWPHRCSSVYEHVLEKRDTQMTLRVPLYMDPKMNPEDQKRPCSKSGRKEYLHAAYPGRKEGSKVVQEGLMGTNAQIRDVILYPSLLLLFSRQQILNAIYLCRN